MSGMSSKVGIIEYVTAKNAISNNLISVMINSGETSDTLFNAVVFNGTRIPADGTQGVVLIIGNDRQNMFWLGAIQDVVQDNRKGTVEQNPGEIFFANDKKNAFVKVNDNIISIANQHTSFLTTKNNLNIAIGNNQLDLTDSEFKVNTKKSKFKLSDTEATIKTEGPIKLISGGDIHLTCKNNLYVTGGLYNSGESDFFKKFGGVNKFLLKAVESKVSIGSMMVLDAGALTVNVCSGLFVGGATPGSGDNTTFKLNVAQGDLIASTGGGDIEVNCLSEINSLSVYAGRKPASALWSEMLVKAMSLKIKNFSGVSASLELSKGKASMITDMDIENKPKMKFIVDATMDIDMKTKTTFKLDATANVEITGQALIKTTTPQLDLSPAKIIKAGPKTVVPSGTGPFCAVQFCPILGIPHAGEMCSGQ